ncbi:hypothetical protein ACOMHN_000713 [Nucella lapillus]
MIAVCCSGGHEVWQRPGPGGGEMSTKPATEAAPCVEFSQHAWRPELCVNCQRPRAEHSVSKPTKTSARIIIDQSAPEDVITSDTSQPVPNKRVSTLPRQSKSRSSTGVERSDARHTGGGTRVTFISKTSTQTTPDGRLKDEKKKNEESPNEANVHKRERRSVARNREGVTSLKNRPPKGILSRKGSSGKEGKKIDDSHLGSRVAFVDTTPQVIGHDGGIGSLFVDDDDEADDEELSADKGSFSLTDEEKSFALLSLENTLWNSDAQNLLKDRDSSGTAQRHSSREFEDLSLDSLCFSKHFQNLKDCDATKRFGTFPLRKRSNSTKLGLDSVFSDSSELNSSHLAALDLDFDKGKSRARSEGSDSPFTRVSLVKSSSVGDGRAATDTTESSIPAYKVVSIVDDRHQAYSVTDITGGHHDPSHKPPDSDSVSENSGSSKGQVSPSESSSPVHVRGRGRPRPSAIRVSAIDRQASPRRDSSAEKGDSDGDALNDSTTAAGLQVLALLNDVLENYGENESSTDDPSEAQDQDKAPGKKATDFEARMASVAASLDLSKQQRAKRPAPRPPSSPPPEPNVSPKKKSQNQPEPVFKMVTVGKGIMGTPPSHDVPKISPGTSLPSFDDLPDGEGERSNGDGGRSKKGITSFFKNILRRGRDSAESFESSNPEVQFAVRSEVTSSSAPSLTEGAPEGMQRKGSDAASSAAHSKVRVLPPGGASGIKGGSASTGDLPKSAVRKSESDGTGESLASSASAAGQGRASSPPSQRSKGLSSPKQRLKRTAAKVSPPTQHKVLPHAKEDQSPSTKPKPPLTTRKSGDDKDVGETAVTQPTPVRRRAKSPKRIPPPAPPARSGGKSEEGGGPVGSTSDLTRELEQKLKSGGISGSTPPLTPSARPPGQSPASKPPPQTVKPDTLARTDLRKSMTVPPPSPPTTKPQVSRSPPASPTPEESDSQPGSPTDEMSNSDESPRFMGEKIELPTAAPGKKGILGKLNMNRKSRAPAPPSSVKRARSISDAEKRAKRINPADISGPVLVTEATNTTTALENRRNTISLGDDPAFASAQSIEKGFDDLDMPILSPLGSLENLYEAILPKEGAPDGKYPFYDPPDATTRALCPNVPAEGYLEPVAPSSVAVATEGSSVDQGEGMGGVSPARNVDGDGVSAAAVSKTSGESGSGEGEMFVEPELTEERRLLIASQPIYEEIPSYPRPDPWKGRAKDNDLDTKSLTSQTTQMTDMSHGSPARGGDNLPKSLPVNSATLPHPKRKPASDTGQRSKRSGSMSSHEAPPAPSVKPVMTLTQPMTSSMTSVLPVTSPGATPSPFMTASMTSSLLWQNTPPAQPVDSNGDLLPLPPIPHMAPRSISKETVSSESDSQSSASTLPRPRPIPRRRPKRPDTTGSDQYVSMNRPNMQVTLGENKLRENYFRLTALNFQTLHDMYIQCERLLALEKISLPNGSLMKWADFDIYGQALHASGRCVVYNAKLRANSTACQLMVLHSRPAAEMSQSTHPSLLRPVAIFADNVPFSFLTADFIKTSQLLQNSVYDSCQARCFLAVGILDIAESLASHLTLLRETLVEDLAGYLRVVLMTTLQLLSALSHCLDRGFTVTETDLGDVFHIARGDLRGKVVAFLPHQRAPDVPQGEAMCGFLDRLLQEATNDFYTPDRASDPDPDPQEAHLLTTVERLRILLEPRRLECLAHARSVVEYLLWGPGKGGEPGAAGGGEGGEGEGVGEGEWSSVEQDHSAWLERERAAMVARFAASLEGLSGGVHLEDFYRLKFLLKSSATSLAECWRRLT